MKSDIFIFEAMILGVSFVCHIILWRRFSFKNQVVALLIVFFIPLILFSAIFLSLSKASFPMETILSVALLHLAITCAYVQTYPAIQHGLSPSLFLLVVIAKHSKGLTEEDLKNYFKENYFMNDKIQDLLNSKLIKKDTNNLSLSKKGRIFVLPFIVLRRMLGLEMGRG